LAPRSGVDQLQIVCGWSLRMAAISVTVISSSLIGLTVSSVQGP
jgi:hypothetical protein